MRQFYAKHNLVIHQKTQKLNNTTHNFEMLTSMEYDHAARLLKIKKKVMRVMIMQKEKFIVMFMMKRKMMEHKSSYFQLLMMNLLSHLEILLKHSKN